LHDYGHLNTKHGSHALCSNLNGTRVLVDVQRKPRQSVFLDWHFLDGISLLYVYIERICFPSLKTLILTNIICATRGCAFGIVLLCQY